MKIINDKEVYTCETEQEAVNIITYIYEHNEVTLGEILDSIIINDCTMDIVTKIYAIARHDIDGWDMFMMGDTRRDIFDVAKDKWFKLK